MASVQIDPSDYIDEINTNELVSELRRRFKAGEKIDKEIIERLFEEDEKPWKMEGSIYKHMGAGIRSISDDRGFATLWSSGTVALDSAHIARLDPQTVSSLATELLALRKRVGDERKRAVAAIHWVFNADGTVGERAMAQEAIHKINDPTFMTHLTNPKEPSNKSAAVIDVLAERIRQVEAEGWTSEHDDQHSRGEMASAAGVYALAAGSTDYRWVLRGSPPNDYLAAALELWPWDRSWFKPKDRRRDLVKAGALILAEIERLDRLSEKEPTS